MRRDRMRLLTGLGATGNGLPSDDQIIAQGIDAGENWLLDKMGVSKDVQDIVNAVSNIGADALAGYLTGVAVTVAAETAGLFTATAFAAVAIPIIGEVIGVVLALVVLFKAFESCSLTVNDTPVGPVSFDCDYYAKTVVPGALRWIQENPQQALTLSPAQFAHQTSIYVFDYPFIGTTDDGSVVEAPPWRPFGSRDDGGPVQVPGAQSMLHMLQLTTAASLAAAFPTLIDLFKVTFPNTYSLLTPADFAAIFSKVEPVRQAFIQRAVKWAIPQRPLPDGAAVHKFMPILTLADADRVAAIARQLVPLYPVSTVPLPIHHPSSDPPKASATAKVATGAAVAGGAGALAIAFVAVKNGISFAQAAKNVYVHGRSLVSRLEK